MKKLYCDNCESEVDIKDLKAGVLLYLNEDRPVPKQVSTDLCGKCMDKVKGVLN